MNTTQTVDLDTLMQEQEAAEQQFETEIAELSDDEKGAKRTERKKATLKAQIDLKEEAKKKSELADNYKKRAEKAESKKGEAEPEPKGVQLTPKDTMVMAKADVHLDDVDEVMEYATFKKISIQDALNSSVIKESLKQNAEARKAAEAANLKTTRTTTTTPQGEALVEAARKGEFPQTDQGIRDLYKARKGIGQKRN